MMLWLYYKIGCKVVFCCRQHICVKYSPSWPTCREEVARLLATYKTSKQHRQTSPTPPIIAHQGPIPRNIVHQRRTSNIIDHTSNIITDLSNILNNLQRSTQIHKKVDADTHTYSRKRSSMTFKGPKQSGKIHTEPHKFNNRQQTNHKNKQKT